MARILTTSRTLASNRVATVDFKSSVFLPGRGLCRIDIAGLHGAALNNGFTLALWFDVSSRSTNELFKNSGANDKLWFNTLSTGAIRFFNQDLANPTLQSATDLVTPGTWHFAVGTYTTTNNLRTIYLDGAQVAQGATTGSLTLSASEFMSVSGNDATNGMVGYACNAIVWNRALTAAEQLHLYTLGIVPVSGLLTWLPCSEGTGTSAHDASGNGLNGALTSTSVFSSYVPSRKRQARNLP